MRHVCPECGEAGEAGTCAKDRVARAPVGLDALLGEQIGSWRIARLIGAGGMGRVYLGVQPNIGARVAIKVLKDANDADVVERFFNEARAVNVIRHEGIIDVIDLGRLPDGAPYIVMDYLDGVPFRALVTRDPRPAAGALAKVLVDVLAALEAAHAKGIIHRDLKPDNIFVSPGGRVTVLDFGIAKLAREATAQTKTGGLLGTPAYMSAEQARAQPLDARSDLYSIGVILYEAATGVLPFSAPSLYDLLDQHVKAKPKPPREIDPAIPEMLEVVILRALEKDPADRFASARDMRIALEAALDRLPRSELQLPAFATAAQVAASDPHAATRGTQPSHPAASGSASDSLAHGETRASGEHASRSGDDSLAHGETRASGEHASASDRSAPRAPASRSASDSLAYGETRASGEQPAQAGTMPGASTTPLERDSVRVSRGLIALMAGSALLGLGAVAYVVIRDREPTTPVVVPPSDASRSIDAPLDAAPDAPPDAPRDAPPDAPPIDAPPIDPPKKVAVKPPPPPPPDLTKGPVPVVIPNMKRFDPVAYFKTAREKAEWIAGGPVRPYKVAYREVDRSGRIDLTAGGAAEYMFAMPPKGDHCLVMIIIDKGDARLSIASSSAKCSGGIGVPRCSATQLWERAIAAGIPETATHASVNLMGRWWRFSTKGAEGVDLKNDCP